MKRIAAPMIGGMVTSFLLELMVTPRSTRSRNGIWGSNNRCADPQHETPARALRKSVDGRSDVLKKFALLTLDIALERSFRVTEKTFFQFRAEAFNALNKVNLGTPNPM